MPQDNRRKSRIGPGLLLKRSIGPGSTPGTDVGNILFSSIRSDQDANNTNINNNSNNNTNPLRRSQHQYPSDASSSEQLLQTQISLAQSQSIAEELDNSIDQLYLAVDQLVDKMAVVADIHAGLASFNESFGAFLYGLKMNAGNVEWTEAPTKRSIERMEQRETEAILHQQHQEELEKIRLQQIQEREEIERQRIEAEKQQAEAERARAMANINNNISNGSSGQDSRRQKRPGLPIVSKGRGIPASRISAKPNQTSGPSRVGPGGAVRKLVSRVVMKRMAERLPLIYRDGPHRGPIEAIMHSLSENIEGQALSDLAAVTGVPKHKCNEYLGVLIHAKEIVRSNQKGVSFALNPDRYPSR
ncbi:hypothetical protein BGZ76_010321 [Entomortierella beljakovae]|nr:hypothetical protein BGZ76_010321 [Entomortierella beljakovae]